MNNDDQMKDVTGKRLIKVLSIDGGGVRGIIPAVVLANLESRLPAGIRIAECFDIIAGTSIGGIIALMLNVPDNIKHPLYSAQYIADELASLSKNIFNRSLWQIIKSVNGVTGPKYDVNKLYSALEQYLHYSVKLTLRNSMTNILVPSYDVSIGKPVLFSNVESSKMLGLNSLCNVTMFYAAAATSAAPTYFKPFLNYIDGGVAINNPAMMAYEFAKDLYGDNIDIMLVSLGTGKIDGSGKNRLNIDTVDNWSLFSWAENIISILLSSETSMTHHELKSGYNKYLKYYRLQPIIDPQNFAIDDVSQSNIYALQQYAEELISKHDKDLEEIAKEIWK